jgi:putative acetyltransferase
VHIREFQFGDEAALHQVFISAIHGVAINDYTLAQVEAWAPRNLDPVLWSDRMRGIAPFVAEVDGKLIAYADVQADGYIDHFFVSAPFARKKVGSKLMSRIHEEAEIKGIRELTSDVSRTAQPFFCALGILRGGRTLASYERRSYSECFDEESIMSAY